MIKASVALFPLIAAGQDSPSYQTKKLKNQSTCEFSAENGNCPSDSDMERGVSMVSNSIAIQTD